MSIRHRNIIAIFRDGFSDRQRTAFPIIAGNIQLLQQID